MKEEEYEYYYDANQKRIKNDNANAKNKILYR